MVNKAYMKRNKEIFQTHRLKSYIVDVAHWQSWMGTDKKSCCQCCGKKNSPACSIKDKRAKGKGSPNRWGEIFTARAICSKCINEIEEFLGVKFKRSYAP